MNRHPALVGVGAVLSAQEKDGALYRAQRNALEDATRVADKLWSNGEENLDEIVEDAVSAYLAYMRAAGGQTSIFEVRDGAIQTVAIYDNEEAAQAHVTHANAGGVTYDYVETEVRHAFPEDRT
jgi:hypothetical protein